MANNLKKIKLGDIELESNVILAPMAGVTDLPFRKIVREFGNFLMFSEMVASQAVIRDVKRTRKMMDNADDPFTSVQIVGADPKVMADAAKLSVNLGAKFIDINMGCPVKKIVKSDAGSALMKNEILASKIFESVVNSVKVPVTLKIRLGWDCENKNAPTIAKIAESSGIQMISVHGRTRSQLYTGTANWKEIAKVRNVLGHIPLIVNGDIIDFSSALKALEESGADGVMIGRGCLGTPWLLSDLHNKLIGNQIETFFSKEEKLETANRHLCYVFEFYGEETGVKISRKVLMYYCKGFPNAAKLRQKIIAINSFQETFDLLDQF